MPGIKALVQYVSDDVVARLRAAGYQVPTDWRILLGSQHLSEQSAPPRIVFVPVGSDFPPRSPADMRQAPQPSAETKLQIALRSIRTDAVTFEVHCWGQAEPPDVEGGDHDATQVLYHTIMQSVQEIASGLWSAKKGSWDLTTQVNKAGEHFSFELQIHTPVLRVLLERAPSHVQANAGVFLQPADQTKPPESVQVLP